MRCTGHSEVLVLIWAALTQLTVGFNDCSQEQLERETRSSIAFPSVNIHNSHQRLATGLHSLPSHQGRTIGPFALDARLPWECVSNVTWRDLGEMYFPRYISEVVCLDSSCWYGHYSCTPVMQSIKVLKMNQENCRDTTLPPSLRRRWILADVETSVFCQCGR